MGDTIGVCPPMIITAAELNELFDRFEKALETTLSWAAAEGVLAG